MATITVKNDGSIEVDPAGISESHYLIDSNRGKCKEIFTKNEWRHSQLVDGFIALHIVLEASLNSLYRQLAIRSIKKEVDPIEVIKNIDKISFIDKTILFIYNSKFDFADKISDATKYHAVIGKLRTFCEIRNQLLHGHAIATITDSDGVSRHTPARANIMSSEKIANQLDAFRSILDGIAFYVSCLTTIDEFEKTRYKEAYLSHDFLPSISSKTGGGQ